MSRYDELRAAAEAASNGNLDTAERVTVGEMQCPLCGDGVVDHKTWTNIDDKPLGIEVFGIGEALTNYETFIRLANPETIKALLAERDSLLAERDEARAISRTFAAHWPHGLNHALDDTLTRALCAVPPPSALNPHQEGSRDHG